ncbi:unnamed protein product [Caenorhabditis brenneri]
MWNNLDYWTGTNVGWCIPIGPKMVPITLQHFHKQRNELRFYVDGIEVEADPPPTILQRLKRVLKSTPKQKRPKDPEVVREEVRTFVYDNMEIVGGFKQIQKSIHYFLEINGKPLKDYKELYFKWNNVWSVDVDGRNIRVVLDKNNLFLYENGSVVENVEKTSSAWKFNINGSIPCKIVVRDDEGTGPYYAFYMNDNPVEATVNLDGEVVIRHPCQEMEAAWKNLD